MSYLRILNASEQVAKHLRKELLKGTWSGTMPGEDRLVAQLGVGRSTLINALRRLEDEGILVSQGQGRRRRIVLPEEFSPPGLQIRILAYEKEDADSFWGIRLLQQLQDEGHMVRFAAQNLYDLGMDVDRVARFVRDHPADAWVVCAGPREVLAWFADQSIPAFALFGRASGINIPGACPRKSPAILEAVRRLVEIGHRGIVMLTREERRKPAPALAEQEFLNELEALGIRTGRYNLPEWEDTMAGFHQGLDNLFQVSPPTALIIIERKLFIAAMQHLAHRGIVAPRDVSMICDEADPGFSWCDPPISHIQWDLRPVLRRVVDWAENVARGREDRKLSYFKAKFFEGGTIGPVPGRDGG